MVLEKEIEVCRRMETHTDRDTDVKVENIPVVTITYVYWSGVEFIDVSGSKVYSKINVHDPKTWSCSKTSCVKLDRKVVRRKVGVYCWNSRGMSVLSDINKPEPKGTLIRVSKIYDVRVPMSGSKVNTKTQWKVLPE